MRAKITKRLIDDLPEVEEGSSLRIADTELRGFGAVKLPSGTVSFVVTWGKRRDRTTIGKYGALTVEQARTKAKEILGKRELYGVDPRDEKRRRKARENKPASTFKAWADEYVIHQKGRIRTWKRDEMFLGEASKAFGSKPLEKVTVEDCSSLFKRWGKRGKVLANRGLASLRACLSEAWRREMIADNPARRVVGFPEPPGRVRVLDSLELSRLAAAVRDLEDLHLRAAFELLIQTGARKSEVLGAKWADVDLEQGLWFIPRAKSGRREVIPLAASLCKLLKDLPRVGPYLIPGREEDTPREDLKRPWDELRIAAEIPGVSIHDLRRSYGLRVAQAHGLHTASRLLRHSNITVTQKHYAPLGIDALKGVAEEVTAERTAEIKKAEKKEKARRKAAGGE